MGSMTWPLILAVIAMAIATAYVLVRGVLAMASGKDVTGQAQQGWMRKRVLYQAIAVFLVMLLVLLARP